MVSHPFPRVELFGALATPARLVNRHDFPVPPERHQVGVLASARDAVDDVLGQLVVAAVQMLFGEVPPQQVGSLKHLQCMTSSSKVKFLDTSGVF